MTDRIADPWGERTPFAPGEEWPARVDVSLADCLHTDDVERWVQSASLLHSSGDGQDIAVKDGPIAGVRGRAQDRVNRGRLGPKDLYGWQANASRAVPLPHAHEDRARARAPARRARGLGRAEPRTATQLKWIQTRMKEAAAGARRREVTVEVRARR